MECLTQYDLHIDSLTGRPIVGSLGYHRAPLPRTNRLCDANVSQDADFCMFIAQHARFRMLLLQTSGAGHLSGAFVGDVNVSQEVCSWLITLVSASCLSQKAAQIIIFDGVCQISNDCTGDRIPAQTLCYNGILLLYSSRTSSPAFRTSRGFMVR